MYRHALLFLGVVATAAAPVQAQDLGTYRWQLQPFCNVITATVHVSAPGVYSLDGYDDQCGAATRAPLTGTATQNPEGTIGIGLSVVTTPGGRGVQIEARIGTSDLGGPWTDSAGHAGTLVFGASTGGSPRPAPLPSSVIPTTISLGTDGALVARGEVGFGTIPENGVGARLMWYPGKAAFRAGEVRQSEPTLWDDASIGLGSAAFGQGTNASGLGSFAAGVATTASGPFSAAFGGTATAAGAFAFAAGERPEATGSASIALGSGARAHGTGSVALGGAESSGFGSVALGQASAQGERTMALGYNAVAIAPYSVAIGSRVTILPTGTGSLAFGDASTTTQLVTFLPNQFVVRAAGGTSIFSSADLSTGVRLNIGASSWSTLSDANSKENFRDLDPARLLAGIAGLPIREWNYKAQDDSIRHVGPTAQDFRAAFGLGEDPLRIDTIDADGVALAGVKALALENSVLKAALASLQMRVMALEQSLARR